VTLPGFAAYYSTVAYGFLPSSSLTCRRSLVISERRGLLLGYIDESPDQARTDKLLALLTPAARP
jgi:hypothetical protein